MPDTKLVVFRMRSRWERIMFPVDKVVVSSGCGATRLAAKEPSHRRLLVILALPPHYPRPCRAIVIATRTEHHHRLYY